MQERTYVIIEILDIYHSTATIKAVKGSHEELNELLKEYNIKDCHITNNQNGTESSKKNFFVYHYVLTKRLNSTL